MKCGTQKETQERLSNYGAMGGAVLAAYLVGSRKYRDWNPISKFAESMTVGYLGGYLVAPLLHKDCPIEDGMALVAPPVGEYGGGFWSKGILGGTPPEGCADWSGVCASEAVYNTIDGSKCPMSPQMKGMLRYTSYRCPEHKQVMFPRPPDPRKVAKAVEARRLEMDGRHHPDPCSAIPRTINNCPPGARCAVGPSPNPEYRACIEAVAEAEKPTFLEKVLWGEGIPTWVWVAGGLGLGLYLGRK